MTCEVAVMNRRGIALAADSAVALSESKKIYHTAEKLYSILPEVPVAIMICGCADLMNVPWETIVKIYAQKLGARRFGTLREYAKDFFSFIEGATALFPAEVQRKHLQDVVEAVWSTYRDKRTRSTPLAEIIREHHHELLASYPDLEGLGSDYGTHIVNTYADALDQVEATVFAGVKLQRQIRQDLRTIVKFMFSKQWFYPLDESGVTIAGMGEDQPFPALLHYCVGTVAAGRLRYTEDLEAQIGGSTDAIVIPIAQVETINMIINGIHPALKTKLIHGVERCLPHTNGAGNPRHADRIHKFKREFSQEISQRYHQPFLTAVSALPRQDLAKMAEALVSLTAFLLQMSPDQSETVAEPIDVAVLSKGDGFIWIKHKDLTGQSGRVPM